MNADTPTPPAQLLSTLRAQYPCITRPIDGVVWEYIDAGAGAHTVLLLPGALGRADTSFRQILALAPAYRVLSLAYPDSIAGLPELLDGIAGVLTTEGVTAPHIVGGSYSGLVAQHFAVRHPQRVASLLLANTAAPNTAVEAQFRRFARAAAWLPEPLLLPTMRAAIPLFLRQNSPEHRFWRAYFTAALPRFSRQGLLNRLHIYAAMNTQAAIRQWTTVPWRGPTLIVEAERDAFTAANGGATLRAHFPQARHVLLPGRGHSAALDTSELYLHPYQEFLCACTSPNAG